MLRKLHGSFFKKDTTKANLFAANCKLIESSKNFTNCTVDSTVNKELLALVEDLKGDDTYLAIAIQASLTTPLKDNKCIGKLYHLKIANYNDVSGDKRNVWHIDSTKVILVTNTGEMNVHTLANIQKGIYDKPLLDTPAEYFISWNNPEKANTNGVKS